MFPYIFKDEYSNFNFLTDKDTITGDTIQVAIQKTDIIENLFEGTELEKSGSIFRGVTLGSNRDLTLNSGFRLQLNGKLSKDIDITAALTDENTPIQPEGNTQKLQELDKVFIEVKSKNLSGTIGDIDVNFQKSEFLNFNRKIQGIKGFGDFNFTNVLISGAVSRGKFNSNSFNGNDGVQGPYRLVGANNELNILVLSGTEKVYLDGVLLTRGEQADYTIDYGLGQITFTNKRLITNASRIIVDFEYTDKKYSRTFLSFSNKFNLFKKKLSFSISYINENDNENKPIDFTLSDSDKVILKNAGDEKLKATKSGVILVGRDSVTLRGIGSYIKIDTLINSSLFSYYKFAPGDSNAVYNITFSYVGQGNGDYSSQNSFQYTFEGIGKGSYAPIIFIPVPTAYQIADLSLEFNPFKDNNLIIKLESAYSNFNKNKFSDIIKNTGGIAFIGNIAFNKNNLKLLGYEFKNINLSFKQRIINKSFNSLDRINSVEFSRNYDTYDTTNATEDLKEGYLTLTPFKQLKLFGSLGQLKRGDFLNSLRTIFNIEFNKNISSPDSVYLPQIKYTFERIKSENNLLSSNGNWTKHNASLIYTLNIIKRKDDKSSINLGFDFISETRKSFLSKYGKDSLKNESFAFFELIPKILLNNIFGADIYIEFNLRKDDVADKGFFVTLSDLFTQKYGLTFNKFNWLSSDFELSIQDRNYSDFAKLSGNTNNKTVLVNSRTRFSPLNGALQIDFLYSISSERTAKIQKLFVLVPVGQGNYIYLGDLNNNGIQDENEFQLVNFDGNYIKLNIPTDQFFPTVDLKTSARITIKPSKYFFIKEKNFFTNLINNITTETYLRIDEKSKDPITQNLYFLKINSFLNDTNTLIGTQLIQQDVNLFENNQFYSLRFRYIQQKGLSQFSSGNEKYLNIIKSFKLKLGLQDITAQLEYINKLDRNIAPLNSYRNRIIFANSFNFELAYRPIKEIESGLQINYTKAEDNYPIQHINASINQQVLRFIYSFSNLGRIRIEIERDEVLMNKNLINFPFELTNGRAEGKSYFWKLIFDYNISKNLQVSVNYDGRVEGKKQVIHIGNAQITAFF